MKKLILFGFAFLALGLFLADDLYAQVMTYGNSVRILNTGGAAGTDRNACVCQAGNVCTADAGEAMTSAMYWHSVGAEFLPGKGQTNRDLGQAYPHFTNDNGAVSDITANNTFNPATTGGNITGANPLPAGANIGMFSTWASKGVGGCKASGFAAGNSYSHAGVMTATDAVLHINYATITMTASLDTTCTISRLDSEEATRAVRHPLGAGHKVVQTTTGSPYGGNSLKWVQLRFASSIMPDPNPCSITALNISAHPNATGDAKFGVRVYRATINRSTSVPNDYALVSFGANFATVRFDGVVQDASIDKMGPDGGQFYINDFWADMTANVNTHYVAMPVTSPQAGLAQNSDGIVMYFEGNSWVTPGEKSLPPDATPTGAEVVSFDAKFNPRTGKVTLNWRTASEDDFAGFNVYRTILLNGKELGPAEKVNSALITAKGIGGEGSDYSLNDTLRLKGNLGVARGRPIQVLYSLELVDLSGSSTILKTTEIGLSKRMTTRLPK